MKRSNKKGFTIVELVIVIAVIAILAAVLIPTIAGLVRKANISSDTVLAKKLNEALAVADEEADTFEDALDALKTAGYLIANLNAKADECYFVWDDANNQIILVDGKEDYKVIYSNTEASAKSNWFVAVNNPEAIAAIEAAGCQVKKIAASFEDLMANIVAGGEVYVDESVVFDNQNTIRLETNASTNVIINLGKSVLNTDGTTLNKAPIYVGAGTLTINGGTVGGAGEYTNENGTFNTAISVDNVFGSDTGAGKLILNNVTVNGKAKAVSGCERTDGDIYIEINNSTLTADYAVTVSCGGKGGIAKVNNTNTNAGINFFASQGSKIVVDGGTHVSNGKVTGEDLSNAIFYLQKGYGTASIEVKGGTFTCNGITKTFEELCTGDEATVIANWKALCWNGETSVDVTIVDGVVILTAK